VVSVKNGKVIHTQNDVKVVEYTLWTPEWNAMVAQSKFKNFRGFNEGIAKEGTSDFRITDILSGSGILRSGNFN